MSIKWEEAEVTTDICYEQKISHNRYHPQFVLFVTIKLSYLLTCYC
jgi:hypothetical protein